MSDSARYDVNFSRGDELALAQYRAISPLAVVALLLGLSSVVALTTPLLWPVPVLAVIVSVVAMKRIAARGANLVGRKAALAGLLLALLFGGAAVAGRYAHNRIVTHRAVQFATVWLELVHQGRVQPAHQMMLSSGRRVGASFPLPEYYRSQPEREVDLERIFSEPPVNRIRELGSRGESRLLGVIRHARGKDEEYVEVLFSIKDAKQRDAAPLRFRVIVHRAEQAAGKPPYWRIHSVVKPKT